MFNPFRLFRRQEQIDDSATAYIEGRATAADEARLRERASRETGLTEELDSIRDTVSLLRSIEPARAPRSFALSYAPARVKPQSRSHRMAFAPAALAVMAAAGVGLLAAGNVADVVQQSGSGSENKTELSSTFETGVAGTPGTSEITGMLPEKEDGTAGEPDEAPPLATGGIPAPQPTSEPAFAPEIGRNSADGTMAADTGEFGEAQITAIEDRVASTTDDGAVSLPVWQLQASLAALAVILAALWLYLRRKASSAPGL